MSVDHKTGSYFLLTLTVHLISASCEHNAVGLADGFILDNQLTASSELNANTPAKNGRLNYTAGSSWCASTSDSSNPYLQIDLQKLHIICAVSTQGNSKGQQWVETYTLQASTDGTTWRDYKENGQSSKRTFNGNYNQNSAVKHILYSGIVARYLRFVSVVKHGGVCLRVEIFGVPRSEDLAFYRPAAQITTLYGAVASRAVDGNPDADFCKGRCTHTGYATDPWWKVDLGLAFSVAEVVIANRVSVCDLECILLWFSFHIRIGNSTQNGGKTNPSCGGTLSMNPPGVKSFYCVPPLVGRYVSVHMTGNRKFITLCEVQVYSTRRQTNNVTGCSGDPVGVSNSSIIPDQMFSASSSYCRSKPSNGRLKGVSAWIPGSNNNNNDYLQIDLGSVYFVCGVATQGFPTADEWTKTYKIRTSLDNVNWKIYIEDNTEKNFTGNYDRNSIVRSELYEPLAARYIRFYPTSFNGYKALRVGVFGSMQVQYPFYSIKLHDVQLIANPSASVTLNCSTRFSQQRPLAYQWRNGATVLSESSSYLTITYSNATDIHSNYHCARQSSSARDVLCSLTYRCTASFIGIPSVTIDSKTNVNVILKVPGQPTVQVNPNNIKAKSTLVTWSYSPGSDEMPVNSYTLQYQNSTDKHGNSLSSGLSSKNLVNLKPYSSYSVRVMATSVLGNGLWSNLVNFTTKTAEVPGQPTVQVNPNNIKARSTLVTWTYSPGSDEMPINSYTLQYLNSTDKHDISLSSGLSSKNLINLKPYSSYSVRVMATSVIGNGLWSNLVNFTTTTAGGKENKECPSCSGTKTDGLVSLISNIALGILLSFSVGWNIWFWRTRRTPVKKTEEKYSPNDEEYEQVDAAVNKQAPGYDNVQPSQESLNYMELQPTRTTQEPTVADPQYMNTRPQYQSLAKRTQRNPNTKVACKNTGPKNNAEESDIYDEINA